MTDSSAPADFTTKRILMPLQVDTSIRVDHLSLLHPQAGELAIDVYRTESADSAPAPLVLLVTGYADPGFEQIFGCAQMAMGGYVSWAELLAGAGFVAVTYRNRDPVQDAVLVWDHLRDNAGTLGIDPQRMGVWSCSGNGPNALALLAARGECAAAALLYCYTLDAVGHSQVADAAADFRFSNPMSGRSLDALHSSTPLLMVRAARDAMPGLNESMDRFIAAAGRRGLPVACLNVPGAPHAFDTDHDYPVTRTAIEQTLSFYLNHLARGEI